MHSNSFSSTSFAASGSAADMRGAIAVVLRAAKKLQRQATGDALAASLPVLRRLLACGCFEGLSLPELHRRRAMVQRKHLLHTLAVEAGHAHWQAYREALSGMGVEQLSQLDVLAPRLGYPNHWFSNLEQAREHARVHGGRVVAVGRQAMVTA